MWMPIMVFFYMGFEHSVVNMYLFPSGLLLGGKFTFMDYLIWERNSPRAGQPGRRSDLCRRHALHHPLQDGTRAPALSVRHCHGGVAPRTARSRLAGPSSAKAGAPAAQPGVPRRLNSARALRASHRVVPVHRFGERSEILHGRLPGLVQARSGGNPMAWALLNSRQLTLENVCEKTKLVMIGNGMAGVRTLEELLKIAPDLYDITVFAPAPSQLQPHPAEPVLAGEQTIDEIILNPWDWYTDNHITLHAGWTVTEVDRVAAWCTPERR